MRYFKADLHIHSCLSACADIDITPLSIIKRSKEIGLHAIAIADHNSAENLLSASFIAEKEGILLIPAMEITSKEEVHILALFETLECAMEMQSLVYRSLPEDGFAAQDPIYQLVVNEREEIMDFNRKTLFGATALSAADIVTKIHRCGGLAVASHVDREYFSLISQLGFIPQEVAIDALEISYSIGMKAALERFANYSHLPWIRNSDAHTINDIGIAYTLFKLEELSFKGIATAFKEKDRIRVRRE